MLGAAMEAPGGSATPAEGRGAEGKARNRSRGIRRVAGQMT